MRVHAATASRRDDHGCMPPRRQLRLHANVTSTVAAYAVGTHNPPSNGRCDASVMHRCATAFGSTSDDDSGGASGGERTRYCIKSDDDAYIHTIRLEV